MVEVKCSECRHIYEEKNYVVCPLCGADTSFSVVLYNLEIAFITERTRLRQEHAQELFDGQKDYQKHINKLRKAHWATIGAKTNY